MLPSYFPIDWLDPQTGRREPGHAGTDLDLALLLVNSYDALDDPPDRLQDLRWLTGALSQVGHETLAQELRAQDLDALQELRTGLRASFETTDIHTAASVLNPMMTAAKAVPLLVPGEPGAMTASLDVGVGEQGLAALQARLPVAVARQIVAFGIDRLGTCHSDPCTCAYVDRTRAGTRRYCCGYCNDRAAARAYRRRNRDERNI